MQEDARQRRRTVVNALKRDLIREAAKRLFAEQGLAATSVREIARAAGYTTGAIYFHYAGKEEIYADILSQSLSSLHEEIREAVRDQADAGEALAAAFRAMVLFYDRHPQDLDLSLYLFGGARRRGLRPDLDRILNERLEAALGLFDAELLRAGASIEARRLEVAALFDEMIGLLVASHTGRLKVLGVDLPVMLDHHAGRVLARWKGKSRP